MGANTLVDAAFVDAVEAQIAHSATVMSVLEIPAQAAARAMELGRKHGVRTILNPAPATPLDGSVLKYVDVLTPNETELRILMGLTPDDPTPTPELARALRAHGVETLVVTMGERGALIMNDDGATSVPGVQVDVVDTTGAGDAFNCGLAVALSEGRSLVEAVRYGVCTGALACTRLGVIPALASREASDDLYRKVFG
jgi:ribokinase